MVELAKEVVWQLDGLEYRLGTSRILNGESLFSMLRKDVSDDELCKTWIVGGGRHLLQKNNPITVIS